MTSRFAPAQGKENPQKRLAGEKAAELVRDGMVVGLGTGSTVYYAIRRLGERVKNEGLDVLGIPTSLDTGNYAQESGILLTTPEVHPTIDLTIDGADEVDPELNLIKGLGGALLMEKIVASISKRLIIVVDPGKLVKRLARGRLPVEILRFGRTSTLRRLKVMGLNPVLRLSAGQLPFVTDSNNYILDCLPGEISNLKGLEREINAIPGVVENGLFIGMTDSVIVGEEDGARVIRRRED